MSLWYKILYQVGIAPWDEDPTEGAAAEQISSLFDREENNRQAPFGQALDLGCGSGISRPLHWLEEMGLIDRIVPITEKNPAKSRRSRYRVADPYVRFWHQIISPLASGGMLGMVVEPERLWREWVMLRVDDYMGMVFETACRDFVRRTDELPFAPLRVGEWWDASSTQQVDIVTRGAGDQLLVAECKWRQVTGQDLVKLRERAASVTQELDRVPTTTHLALFSGSGSFDNDVGQAIWRGDVLGFEAADLY